MRFRATFASLLVCSLALADDPPAPRPLPGFDRIVIDDEFPGAYQVELADVNGDGHLDIVALGGGTCAWYENPSWKKRVITGPDRTPGIISSATIDLDGDGRAEVAIAYDFAMREPTRGKLGLAIQGNSHDDPWSFREIAEVPSIHRVRWGTFRDFNEKDPQAREFLGLVAAPIFGPADEPPDLIRDKAEVLLFNPGHAPKTDPWASTSMGRRPVLHAIEVINGFGKENDTTIFTADNLGVGILNRPSTPQDAEINRIEDMLPGASGNAPFRGCSEVRIGVLGEIDRLIATIEPWHGDTVVAWILSPSLPPRREVLDDTLDQGHALCVADVNGDGVDEVFAGHRGEDHRVSVYHFDGTNWNRTVLDHEIAAQDLRSGDLNSDGIADIVAVGGSTGNIVMYRPQGETSSTP